AVGEAVRVALDQAEIDGPCITLGSGFKAAPKISIDYAVMEKTSRASVLPVRFEWSDLGAWDSVHASGEGDVGLHILEDSEGCLVRACDGVMVAAIGLRDVGIIVERDAVLVTDLKKSQDVKKVVERLRKLSPQHLDFPSAKPLVETEGGRWPRVYLHAPARNIAIAR
ncbi:MAG: mannose-1-phosphate guanylyltransferase, partial [Hyphomonas sp.]